MRFFYILNNKKEMITGGKLMTTRSNLFETIINVNLNEVNFTPLNLNRIYLNAITIEKRIDNLLVERNSNSLDIPDYKGRFKEEEVFEWKQYKTENLKLCNTGFDSSLIFLINIYNSVLKDENPYYILLTDNHKQLKEFSFKKEKQDIIFSVICNNRKYLETTIQWYNKINKTDFEIIKFIEDEVNFANIKVSKYKTSDIFSLGYLFGVKEQKLRDGGEIDW